MIKSISVVLVALLFYTHVAAQSAKKQPEPAINSHGLLWEVTGKGLKRPTYIYGTFHLLNSSFFDSLPVVKQKMQQSEIVVGEVVIDSAAMQRVAMEGFMFGSKKTLRDFLSPEDYNLVNRKLKELGDIDLAMLNQAKPLTVQIYMAQLMLAKELPQEAKAGEKPMDLFFQEEARKSNKKVLALETVEDQVQVLYGQYTLERQAEMLVDFVKSMDESKNDMQTMISCYMSQNLQCLSDLFYKTGYTQQEIDNLNGNRNKKWMQKLPEIMKKESAFVAVGAMHLTGEDGLISLLIEEGYTVKPVKLK